MYKFYTKKFLLFLFITTIFLLPMRLHAQTYVLRDDLRYGATWDEYGSPYILNENIYIPKDYSLVIKSGVTVMSASSTDPYEDPHSLTFDGDLSILGTKENPVKIFGLYSLYFSHSNVGISNAVFDSTGLDFFQSTSTINSTIIKNSINAIKAIGSNIKIDGSQLINNQFGIASYPFSQGPFLIYGNDNSDGIGGLGNVLEDIVDPEQNIISINNSVITDNSQYEISNATPNPIDATDNWWGSVNGPDTAIINGLVNVSPWKDKDPREKPICCSNVLFIPGIEASRLYKTENGLFGTSTNTLWEPNRNDDVRKLFLDSNGKSIDRSIYTSDILDSAYGLKNIYKSFITMMDGVVADGAINQWLSFPYDWRMGVNDIVYNKTQLATSSISLIQTLEKLAYTSKTEKVIIIAHSNGGLVTKTLMRALEDQGKSDLIEEIILVAVPELGTPQALLAMLHGYNQSIASGLILSENTARTFSQNMLGAYGLLPSKEYFNKNPLTIISNLFSNIPNPLISTYEAMKSFLINNPFSKASSTDMNIPLLLNPSLISSSEAIHSLIDKWKPASSTKTLSILGWGMPTPESITYEKDKHCNIENNKVCNVAFLPSVTDRGDGTVMVDANASSSDSTLFFNLKKLKDDTRQSIDHADILESSSLQSLLMNSISGKDPDNGYKKYFTTTEPIDTDRWLTIKIYSPVDINIYDSEGNHTGPIENPVIGRDLKPYENNIPHGYYGDFGRIKMVRIPYDGNYQISLKGTDTGVFSADASIEQFDKVIASTTFDEMPVTTLMNADMIISTSTSGFATSSMMLMDVDGDGTTDLVNHSAEYLQASSTDRIADLSTYLESMRKVIIALKLSPKDETLWLNKIDKIEKLASKKHLKKIERIAKKIADKKFKKKSLTDSQKQALLSMFGRLLAEVESNLN